MMNRVIIALGSNIDKEENIRKALALLKNMCQVTAVATLYETIPVGLRDQPNFLNTAVLIETPLEPTAIKQKIINHLETVLNRVRQANPNAPRTIDADIILFNDAVLDYDGGDGRLRHIPDPDLRKFPHVAVPTAELAPEMPHPETGEKLQDIANRLMAEITQKYGTPPLWPRQDLQPNDK